MNLFSFDNFYFKWYYTRKEDRLIRKKLISTIFVTMLAFFSIFVSGCDISFNTNSGEEKIVSGKVLFENNGLEEVTIKSKYKEFCETNSNGEFYFKTKQSNVEIYAEKNGYSFTGSFILTESVDHVIFTAEKVTNLDGQLALKRIVVTPIAMLSLYNENYEYSNAGIKSLKAGYVEANINGINVLKNENIIYLAKNKNYVFELNNEEFKFNIDKFTEFVLNFKLNAFVMYNQDEELINDNYTTLSKSNLKTDVVHDGKASFDLFGINSVTGGYTYNICFEFEYIPN